MMVVTLWLETSIKKGLINMSISENDIAVGGVYKTPGNQERVVLAMEDGKVKYASRGGNVQNQFDHMEECEPTRFANACSSRIADLPKEKFEEIQTLFKSREKIS
jgi:hypothetical protein